MTRIPFQLEQLSQPNLSQPFFPRQEEGKVVKPPAFAGQLDQENLLREKYEGLLPKKKMLSKQQKFFDSADWALSKQQQEKAVQQPSTTPLHPKLAPTVPASHKSLSHLRNGLNIESHP
jgi:hypothetical protein